MIKQQQLFIAVAAFCYNRTYLLIGQVTNLPSQYFLLKTTQFAFSTAHRTKSLYFTITLLVTRVRCWS